MGRPYQPLVLLLLGVSVTGTSCANDPLHPYFRNRSPVISSVSVVPTEIGIADSAVVTCLATDQDGDTLVYDWDTDPRLRIKGNPPNLPTKSNTLTSSETFYPNYQPTGPDTVWVACSVRDRRGGGDIRVITFIVRP